MPFYYLPRDSLFVQTPARRRPSFAPGSFCIGYCIIVLQISKFPTTNRGVPFCTPMHDISRHFALNWHQLHHLSSTAKVCNFDVQFDPQYRTALWRRRLHQKTHRVGCNVREAAKSPEDEAKSCVSLVSC